MTVVSFTSMLYCFLIRQCVTNSFYRINWIEVAGTYYKPNMVVLYKMEQDIPIFGQISEILNSDDKFWFALTVLETQLFNSHFHSYEVKKTNLKILCEATKIYDYHPLWLYQSYDSNFIDSCFISLKYHVVNEDCT